MGKNIKLGRVEENIMAVGKEYQVGKRGREYHGCWGRISSWEEGKGISWLLRKTLVGKRLKEYHGCWGRISSWEIGRASL